jgi:hypothetical protein
MQGIGPGYCWFGSKYLTKRKTFMEKTEQRVGVVWRHVISLTGS